jgi:MFS family permease
VTPVTPDEPQGTSWLTRNLIVLSGVSLLQDAASELVYPVLPLFLTITLGAPAAVVGVVEGLAEGAASVTKLLSGTFSDRVRRRPLIGLGYGLAAVAKALIALATVWPLVLVARCVDRLGKGIRGAPRDALLVQDIPVEARGRAFGLHRTADTLGAVIGPLVGLAAYELLGHRIRPLLVVAVVPAVLSALLVAAVREKRREPPPHRDAVRPRAIRDLPTPVWRVVAVVAVFSLVNFPDALLLLRVHALGYGVPGVIAAYVVYNAAYAALSYPAGALADRLPRPRVFGIGIVCFAIGYLGLGLAHSRLWVWPLLLVYGGFTAFTDGVGKAWVSGVTPAWLQGSAQGVFQSVTGLGVLVAGVWAGLAWGHDGRVPLLISGAVGAVMAVVLLSAGRRVEGPAVVVAT